jgi:hypothetical protein
MKLKSRVVSQNHWHSIVVENTDLNKKLTRNAAVPSACRSRRRHAVDEADGDRRRRRQGPRLPPRRRHAGHLPRLQGVQHPARLGERSTPRLGKFHVTLFSSLCASSRCWSLPRGGFGFDRPTLGKVTAMSDAYGCF